MPTSCSLDARAALRRQLAENTYPGYVYGYPHKKAYRPLPSPVPLADAWAGEAVDNLSCYVHIPFCGQRCSFCNLFTLVPSGPSPAAAYLDALPREMDAYAAVLGPAARFRRLYLGGGTPTFLTSAELVRLVGHLRAFLGVDPATTQSCIEASPETLNADKLETLRGLGFRRLSLGVQSFAAGELRQVNRRFDFALNRRAVELIGRAGFPEFNIDLIYGLPGQTSASWLESLKEAADSSATSLYLYPLYVRPLTGLDRRSDTPPAPTPTEMGVLYDEARAYLIQQGFQQKTMRHFQRGERGASASCLSQEGVDAPHSPGADYRCQRDGLVGLGAGARSYTRTLHYSTPWKMVARNIRAVIDAYTESMRRGETAIRHGFVLDADERCRRYVIQSLLADGLDLADFAETCYADAAELFAPQWDALLTEGCVARTGGLLRLTPRGVRHADVVGQLFFSPRVNALVEAFEYDT